MIDHAAGETPGDPARPAAPAGSNLAGLTDEDCAILAREGQEAARDLLVRRHASGVYRLLLRLLEDRDEAADAAQEVFLRLFAHIDRFEPRRSFRGWLFSIAWNHARDRLRCRARRRRRGVLSLQALGASPGEEPLGLDPVDPRSRPPGEQLDRREEAARVRRAIARLDPRQRALLVLREYEDLSYEEIAQLLGWRLGSVKSRIHRARMALKSELERLRPDPSGVPLERRPLS